MKKLHIAVYVMPWEVDEFFGLCNRLKMASKYIKDRSNEILLDVTLNLSSKLIDWENSKIPKQLLEDRFNHALQLCDWCELKSNIVTLEGEFGCNDKRRNVIEETNAKFVCFVDSDIVFNETALYYILQGIDISLDTPYVIISQELPRMWDGSWDSIVAKKYINLPYKGDEHYINFDFTEIDIPEDVNIEINNTIKFSGGFLTTISSNLAKEIKIPKSLGSYKLDDTFLLFCSYKLAEVLGSRYIKQYILRGLTITEDRKYQNQTLKKYLTMNTKYIRDRETIESLGAEDPVFMNEVQQFCDKKIPEIVKKHIK
tara:strand:+ start:12751 stop:13692 length:942 start_codon:yes stop_codon:yes gene_type:complete